MAGLVDSYKKVFENRDVNGLIFVLVLIWSVLSNLTDIALGQFDSFKQNPVDLVFNLFLGLYSLHFFNNAIKYNYSLPFVRELNYKNLLGMVLLNIVWGFYVFLGIVLILLLYILTHSLVLTGIAILALMFVISPLYYIFIAFADDFKLKGLFNISLIFKFINKDFYIRLGQFILLSGGFIAVYFLLYILAEFWGIAHLAHIADEYYLFDAVMYIAMAYLLVITWVFAFPYSLVESYKEKIRPIVKGVENGENA